MEKRKQPVRLIGISGKIGSGKDTFAELIKIIVSTPYLTDATIEHYLKMPNPNVIKTEWTVKKFAGKLKEVASLLTGIPVYKFEDQEFKKSLLGEEWATPTTSSPLNAVEPFKDITFLEMMSVREFLQKLGTEAMRNGLHTNTWVNATFATYNNTSRWLITDVRFPNEAEAVKQKGGLLVRINRNSDTGDHPSETSLDNYDFEITIDNTGTLQELITKTKEFCETFNLIPPLEEEDFPAHTEGFF
jgi:hypothetical protein